MRVECELCDIEGSQDQANDDCEFEESSTRCKYL